MHVPNVFRVVYARQISFVRRAAVVPKGQIALHPPVHINEFFLEAVGEEAFENFLSFIFGQTLNCDRLLLAHEE